MWNEEFGWVAHFKVAGGGGGEGGGGRERIPIKNRLPVSQAFTSRCIFGIPSQRTMAEERGKLGLWAGFRFSGRLNGQLMVRLGHSIDQHCLLSTQLRSRGIQSMESIIDDNRYQLIPGAHHPGSCRYHSI